MQNRHTHCTSVSCAAKDAGNGAATQTENLTFVEQVVQVWDAIKSLLPYGSWWDVMDKGQHQQEAYGITFVEAMKRLWILISPDRLVIAAAFTALIIAAVNFLHPLWLFCSLLLSSWVCLSQCMTLLTPEAGIKFGFFFLPLFFARIEAFCITVGDGWTYPHFFL